MGIESKLAARDTPAGRKYESNLIFWDSLILLLGCAGIVFGVGHLVVVAAAAHVFLGFLQSPVKWFWVVSSPITLTACVAVFVGGVYAAQVYGRGIESAVVVSDLKQSWIEQATNAIVFFGICGHLLAYPGTVDQLREHLDRLQKDK